MGLAIYILSIWGYRVSLPLRNVFTAASLEDVRRSGGVRFGKFTLDRAHNFDRCFLGECLSRRILWFLS